MEDKFKELTNNFNVKLSKQENSWTCTFNALNNDLKAETIKEIKSKVSKQREKLISQNKIFQQQVSELHKPNHDNQDKCIILLLLLLLLLLFPCYYYYYYYCYYYYCLIIIISPNVYVLYRLYFNRMSVRLSSLCFYMIFQVDFVFMVGVNIIIEKICIFFLTHSCKRRLNQKYYSLLIRLSLRYICNISSLSKLNRVV